MSYKKLIRQQVINAKIPYAYRSLAQEKIIYALRTLRLNAKISAYLYSSKNRTRIGPRSSYLKAGRPTNKREVAYLISVLNTVWMQAFGKKPRLNHREGHQTAFVVFAEPIMASVGIHNALDNLNKYRRYVNRISRIIDRRHYLVIQIAK